SCSARTIYRMYKNGLYDSSDLQMKVKLKQNGHQERRGKQTFRRSFHVREKDYCQFSNEFGHLVGDTIVGVKDIRAVIS
ncbi:IS30 family transposase, partial [Enterococcus faecium]